MAATGDLRLVEVALGHRSVATTERYTAVAPARLVAGAELTVSRLFGDLVPAEPPPAVPTAPLHPAGGATAAGLDPYDPGRPCRRCQAPGAGTVWREPVLERTWQRGALTWAEAPPR